MVNQVAGLDGYNLYQHANSTVTKVNSALIPEAAKFTVGQLLQNTDYSGVFEIRPVDKAGNETSPGLMITTGNAAVHGTPHTLNPLPDQNPMASTLTAGIDAIAAKCLAAGAGPGITIMVDSPLGYYVQSYGTGTAANDYYRLASQTKSFTGHAVLMALDKGLLSLDDHLSKYLSGYAKDPTIRQMMMMQSGIYDYEQDQTLAIEFVLFPTMSETVDQIISVIQSNSGAANPSVFDPGTAYFYTNSNYYLLAKIVEAVDTSHRTIDQIIMQDILTPLGMVNTYFQIGTGTPLSPYAIEYDNNLILSFIGLPLRQDVSNQNSAFVWAAGAMISQVGDMIKWGKELRDGTLLHPDTHATRMSLFTQQPAVPAYGLSHTGPPTFGYGEALVEVGSWKGHDGSWLGCDSCTMFEPGTGSVITVYENFQTNGLLALTTIWFEIAEYLFPGSAIYPGYAPDVTTTESVTAMLPMPTVEIDASVYEVGAFQPFSELYSPGGLASVTGKPVPDGATTCYVTIFGEGGPGGRGGPNINQSGGSGGGGAGRVNRTRIPVALLGTTFDATFGPAATQGNPGSDAVFASGGITLTAKGGKPGNFTGTYNATVAGGVGGGWSATPDTIDGVAVTGVNGQNGADASMYAGASGHSDTVSDGAAGGGAGGGNTNSGSPGGKGGDSLTQVGGATGSPGQAPADVAAPPPLHGGAGGGGGHGAPNYGYSGQDGGHGGRYGGGGGGGGCTWGASPGAGEPGGDPAILVEWE